MFSPHNFLDNNAFVIHICSYFNTSIHMSNGDSCNKAQNTYSSHQTGKKVKGQEGGGLGGPGKVRSGQKQWGIGQIWGSRERVKGRVIVNGGIWNENQ